MKSEKHFAEKSINRYAEQHTTDLDQLLYELERETWLTMLSPQMLSGKVQGQFLSLISRLKQPQRILEIGTFTGFSALCLAEGLTEEGQLHTIEWEEEREWLIQKYFDRHPRQGQLHLHIGDAKEIIPTLHEKWDLVFIDADKPSYNQYLDLVIGSLAPGGLIIADNVLWFGKVTSTEVVEGSDTWHLQQFNQKIQADPRLRNFLLPFRDGLMVAERI